MRKIAVAALDLCFQKRPSCWNGQPPAALAFWYHWERRHKEFPRIRLANAPFMVESSVSPHGIQATASETDTS
jgi:hypothetical protein